MSITGVPSTSPAAQLKDDLILLATYAFQFNQRHPDRVWAEGRARRKHAHSRISARAGTHGGTPAAFHCLVKTNTTHK